MRRPSQWPHRHAALRPACRLARARRQSSLAASGTRASMQVPCLAPASTRRRPRSASMRSRMPTRPLPGTSAPPRPSSSTRSTASPASTPKRTCARRARAWRWMLVTASRTVIASADSTAAGRPAPEKPSSKRYSKATPSVSSSSLRRGQLGGDAGRADAADRAAHLRQRIARDPADLRDLGLRARRDRAPAGGRRGPTSAPPSTGCGPAGRAGRGRCARARPAPPAGAPRRAKA